MKVTNMQDMSLSGAEQAEILAPHPPKYPYGLCISLCEDEVEKLDLDIDEVEIGDMIHFMAMASVTSISEREDAVCGPTCRIELQITHMGSVEDEDKEDDKKVTSKLYRK